MSIFRVGSYNICHAAYADGDLEKIGNVICEAGLDICGIQEIEYKTNRVGGFDQPALLAAASGLPYYRFVRAIDYDGGLYGTMLLSQYPIIGFDMAELASGNAEKRAVGHAVLQIEAQKLDFYVTHLSYESNALRKPQFEVLAQKLAASDTYVLVGDFNTEDFSEFDILHADDMANKPTRRIVTFPETKVAIDNIVLSKKVRLKETGTVEKAYSDHYLLWADVAMDE